MNPSPVPQEESPQPTQGNDPKFVEALSQRYGDEIFRFVAHCLGNAADADDVVQEVWTALLTTGSGYDSNKGASERTYLYQVVRGRLSNHWRQGKRQGRTTLAPADAEGIVDPTTVVPDQNLGRKELQRKLQAALQQLSEDYRTALVLRLETGLTVYEIGEVLRRTEKAVESLLTRARKELVEALGGPEAAQSLLGE